MRRVIELTDFTTPTSTDAVATYLLVQAESDVDLAKLVSGVHGLPGVVNATRVIGPYDVIAEASIRSEQTRASLAAAVAGIPGVMRVLTMPTGSSAGETDDTSWAA
jgi:hypothetical protein